MDLRQAFEEWERKNPITDVFAATTAENAEAALFLMMSLTPSVIEIVKEVLIATGGNQEWLMTLLADYVKKNGIDWSFVPQAKFELCCLSGLTQEAFDIVSQVLAAADEYVWPYN